MSNSIITAEQNVNRYSDFTMGLTLLKDGAAYVPDNFVIGFFTDGYCKAYVASRINGVYNNCAVEGNTINIYFDKPRFPLGQLKCRFYEKVENDNFSDGYMDTCVPITALPVNIVAGAGDENVDVEVAYPSLMEDIKDYIDEQIGEGGAISAATAEEVDAECDLILT